jgi:small-conductance mechanosensitive channel
VGDLIKVGDTAGIVLSIDLLSVKLRKFDNTFVRIPNESLIKGELTNVTRFPIRRFDLNMGVAYREDISRAINVLKEIADNNPYSLDEPAPMVAFTGFGDSALNIFMGVWFSKTDYLALRDSLLPEIKRRFDEEGIEIPFPHRTVYTGSMSEPFPIQVIQPDKAEDAAEAENLR